MFLHDNMTVKYPGQGMLYIFQVLVYHTWKRKYNIETWNIRSLCHFFCTGAHASASTMPSSRSFFMMALCRESSSVHKVKRKKYNGKPKTSWGGGRGVGLPLPELWVALGPHDNKKEKSVESKYILCSQIKHKHKVVAGTNSICRLWSTVGSWARY